MSIQKNIARYVKLAGLAAMSVIALAFLHKWVIVNYVLQSGTRDEIIQLCRASQVCRGVGASVTFDRVESRPIRKLVLRMVRNADQRESRTFADEVSARLDERYAHGNALTRGTVKSMLPVEVRYD